MSQPYADVPDVATIPADTTDDVAAVAFAFGDGGLPPEFRTLSSNKTGS